jgi:hypothetical protein
VPRPAPEARRRRRWPVAAAVAVAAVLLALLWSRGPGSGPAPGPAAPPPSPAPPPGSGAAATAQAPFVWPGAAGAAAAPGATAFEGRVLSLGTGAPVAGAELTFSRAGAAASARSGPDGAFLFQPPQAGRWQLAAASAKGHLPFAPEWGHSPVTLEAREGERLTGLAVWLEPQVTYAGRVLDPKGQPVPGAEVRLLEAATGENALLPLADRFTSDAVGAFSFSAPEGAVLEARHPGFAPGRARVDFAARVGGRVTVTLGEKRGDEPARGQVAGRVTSLGAPQEGALVTARRQRGRGPGSAEDEILAQALSGPDGRFTLRDLEAGTWLVGASHPGFAPSRAVGVRTGTEDVQLDLVAGGAVAGTVRERGTGRPVAPFTVTVRRTSGPGRRLPPRAATVVDPSGRFEVDGLPPGPAVLQASAPGRAPSAEIEVQVPEPPGVALVDVELPAGGRLTGRVVERGTGRALPGARVSVEGEDAPASLLGAWSVSLAGPDGRFELAGLPARPLSLFVAAEGHHGRILSGIQVPDGGAAGPLTVELGAVAEGEDPRVELAGIGAVLERSRAGLRISRVIPGGGAAEAGLAPGDEILAVEGRPVAEIGFAGAVQAIRGPEDSVVVLTVRRGDAAPADVRVWRRLVKG